MPPIEFHPILKRIRWGGRRLGSVLGKPLGPENDYAESWEIADHGLDQSQVTGGAYDGWPLKRLVAEKGSELFGENSSFEQFPLLIKFLDATDRLSVQVHPDGRRAKQYDPSENGKTEAWVILDADADSRLYAGLKSDVDRRMLADSLASGRAEDCLHSFPVAAGDCLFIPAGTVHAIGEGILLAEIQQSSDLTFRLYDWNRVDTDGKPRALHIDAALDCIDFKRGPVDPVTPKIISDGKHRLEELVHSDYFVIQRHTSAEPFTITPDGGFRILMMLGGEAEWNCGETRGKLSLGQTILLPASCAETRFLPNGEVVALETFVP